MKKNIALICILVCSMFACSSSTNSTVTTTFVKPSVVDSGFLVKYVYLADGLFSCDGAGYHASYKMDRTSGMIRVEKEASPGFPVRMDIPCATENGCETDIVPESILCGFPEVAPIGSRTTIATRYVDGQPRNETITMELTSADEISVVLGGSGRAYQLSHPMTEVDREILRNGGALKQLVADLR
jgi:hypothetical protein